MALQVHLKQVTLAFGQSLEWRLAEVEDSSWAVPKEMADGTMMLDDEKESGLDWDADMKPDPTSY